MPKSKSGSSDVRERSPTNERSSKRRSPPRSSRSVRSSQPRSNRSSKGRRKRHNPHRFLRPTSSTSQRDIFDDRPSLEIHGVWVYPFDRYEPIERVNRTSEREISRSRSKVRSSSCDRANQIPQEFCPCLQKRRCCCCCCCCCKGSSNQSMSGRGQFNQSRRQSDQFNQPRRRVQSKPVWVRSLRRPVSQSMGKDNASVIGVSRHPKTKSTVQQTGSMMDDEVEFEGRREMDLASVRVNKASSGFNSGIVETNANKNDTSKGSKDKDRSK